MTAGAMCLAGCSTVGYIGRVEEVLEVGCGREWGAKDVLSVGQLSCRDTELEPYFLFSAGW